MKSYLLYVAATVAFASMVFAFGSGATFAGLLAAFSGILTLTVAVGRKK